MILSLFVCFVCLFVSFLLFVFLSSEHSHSSTHSLTLPPTHSLFIDRNIGNEKYAAECFKEINSAYSILKDPHQRQYYNQNRESILRGEEQYSHFDEDNNYDHITPDDLRKYFWHCYNEYDDSSTGFFAVYRNLFDHLIAREIGRAHV